MPIFELNCLVSYDDESLIAELQRVAALVGQPYLTATAFDKHSKVHSTCIRRRFGKWHECLARAGLEYRYSGRALPKRISGRPYTNEQMIAELRNVSAKIGTESLTVDFFNQHAEMSGECVRRRFGSWGAALKAAGIAIAKSQRRHSEDDYFENLLAVWTHYGRQPKYGEMDEPPSSITPGAYEAKWGTWRKALLAFIEKVNSDTGEEASPKTGVEDSLSWPTGNRLAVESSKREDRHPIRLGLRYDVLRRDRFRCVACGASPATRLDCNLHVDHIIPWAKGGKTETTNLRTLCQSCNLGKSAKLEGESSKE